MLEDEEDCASHEHQDHAALRWFVPHLTKCLGWHSSAYLISYMFSIDHSAFTMSQFNDNKNSKIDDSEEGVPSVIVSLWWKMAGKSPEFKLVKEVTMKANGSYELHLDRIWSGSYYLKWPLMCSLRKSMVVTATSTQKGTLAHQQLNMARPIRSILVSC